MRSSRKRIEQELKQRIRSGVYAPGSRMPSHRQLQTELQASSVTLQLAFDRLVERGYVEPRGAHGTFVAPTLPMDSRVAVIFADEVGSGAWNRFWGTAKRVAEAWTEGDLRFKPYCIANRNPSAPVHQQLCDEVADGALAGLVFASQPYYLADSPLLTADLPRVCIGSGAARERDAYRASQLTISSHDALEDVLHRLAAQGRQRLAVLSAPDQAAAFHTQHKALLRSLGLELRPEWRLGLPVNSELAPCARTVTHLLCASPAAHRPDCLLIADDNLVPHATAGIQDAGVQVPAELAVAAHANFPDPTRAHVPCLRFGPDLTTLLRTAADEIQHLARGGERRIVEVSFAVR